MRYLCLFGLTPPEWVSVETDLDLVDLWCQEQVKAHKNVEPAVCKLDGAALDLLQVVAVIRDDKGGRLERPER
jgi:hypothetical protein